MATNSDSPSSISYSSFSGHLESLLPPNTRTALTKSVLPGLVQSLSSIGSALRSSQRIALAGTANAFGDDQLNVDVLAEKIIRDAIAQCPAVVTASSEEDPVEKPARVGESNQVGENGETYTVAFDPLDGSSIIAPNWTVGAIIGVWDGPSALNQSPAEKQIASILGVFGPRTTATIAIRVPGTRKVCLEVGISAAENEGGCNTARVEVIRSEITLQEGPFKTRYFAPANLRSAAEDDKYASLINYYIQNKYTLRYSGGLVPDVMHALVKGHGIYLSPVTGVSKAKLRRLYELAPVALIIECAGGRAIDPADGKNILERSIEDCDERAGLICGTADEVEIVRRRFALKES